MFFKFWVILNLKEESNDGPRSRITYYFKEAFNNFLSHCFNNKNDGVCIFVQLLKLWNCPKMNLYNSFNISKVCLKWVQRFCIWTKLKNISICTNTCFCSLTLHRNSFFLITNVFSSFGWFKILRKISKMAHGQG